MRTAMMLTCLVAAIGCGKHPGTYETAAATKPSDAAAAAVEKADALWEERVDEAKLQEAIQAYEAAFASNPADRHTLVRLTRGYYFWGDGFTEDKTLQIERWGKAIEWGARCLALNEGFAQAVNGGAKEKDAIAQASKDDVPCIYWTATALGKWGKVQGTAKTLKFLPTVKAYMSKAEELDEQYYHYGPARYWGAYYAALPSFAGQDLVKSAAYFEAAIQGAPYYLPTRVLRADMLTVAKGDLKQFDADLKHVLAADPDAKPDAKITPENVRDVEKAKRLQARRPELFDKKAIAEADGA